MLELAFAMFVVAELLAVSAYLKAKKIRSEHPDIDDKFKSILTMFGIATIILTISLGVIESYILTNFSEMRKEISSYCNSIQETPREP